MKIILFLGIVAILIQNISCQCEPVVHEDTGYVSTCCIIDLPITSSKKTCCFDSDQNCCVSNGRCERGQAGGSCTQSKLVWSEVI